MHHSGRPCSQLRCGRCIAGSMCCTCACPCCLLAPLFPCCCRGLNAAGVEGGDALVQGVAHTLQAARLGLARHHLVHQAHNLLLCQVVHFALSSLAVPVQPACNSFVRSPDCTTGKQPVPDPLLLEQPGSQYQAAEPHEEPADGVGDEDDRVVDGGVAIQPLNQGQVRHKLRHCGGEQAEEAQGQQQLDDAGPHAGKQQQDEHNECQQEQGAEPDPWYYKNHAPGVGAHAINLEGHKEEEDVH
mmetsp:Transcript_38855/g.86430  ORF Transcript_38855/g.86430 Transcript_38855/m.86430 type:complete len:243 (-) Transcript_38855:572-1300(-)